LPKAVWAVGTFFKSSFFKTFMLIKTFELCVTCVF
jgi:hypothetical protein